MENRLLGPRDVRPEYMDPQVLQAAGRIDFPVELLVAWIQLGRLSCDERFAARVRQRPARRFRTLGARSAVAVERCSRGLVRGAPGPQREHMLRCGPCGYPLHAGVALGVPGVSALRCCRAMRRHGRLEPFGCLGAARVGRGLVQGDGLHIFRALCHLGGPRRFAEQPPRMWTGRLPLAPHPGVARARHGGLRRSRLVHGGDADRTNGPLQQPCGCV
mmetsp:Transcript_85964/g.263043  ORF Transcript_85964/g.263043 Transcript_85964/m.263043 type:complete len:217 (+) Transcript_85964:271-921(+)